METEGIASRLKYLITLLELSDSQFADKCGISRATLSLLLAGKNKKISDVLLSQIHKAFPHVSILWLLFKEGDAIIDPNSQLSDAISGDDNKELSSLWGNQESLFDNSLLGENEDALFLTNESRKNKNSNLIDLNLIEKNIQEAVNKGFERFLKNNSSLGFPGNLGEKDKKIRQITVYYDDSTFETFSPGVK